VLDFLGLQFPLSITEGYTDGTAFRVTKAMWKAYGQKCGGDYTYLRIGRPLNEEYEIGSPFSQQDFERGHMRAYRNDAQNVVVYVYDNSWNLLCSQGAGTGGFYDWLDLDHQPCYDVDGNSVVNINDVYSVAARMGTSETAPINPGNPGLDYDDRYDADGNGAININDPYKVAAQAFANPRWVCR